MKLTLIKSKTVVERSSLEYKAFTDLLDKDEDIGNQLILYVFLVCDISNENPIRDVPYTSKVEEAKDVIFNDPDYNIQKELGDEWNSLVAAAMKCYETYLITDEEKDIYAYDKKMDQFREMLLETSPKIEKNFGTTGVSYSTNIEIINNVLEDIVTLIQTKASLVSMMVQGMVPKHLRGGLSPLSTGQINTTKNDSKEEVRQLRPKQTRVEYKKKGNSRKTWSPGEDS